MPDSLLKQIWDLLLANLLLLNMFYTPLKISFSMYSPLHDFFTHNWFTEIIL